MVTNPNHPRPALRRMTCFRGPLAALVLLIASQPTAFAQSDPRQASLQGITSMGVDIQILPTAATLGVDASTVKTKIVAALEKLVTFNPALTVPDGTSPVLRIVVDARIGTNGLSSIFVETAVREKVTLIRSPAITPIADTWRVANPPGAVPTAQGATTVLGLIAVQFATFKSSFSAANGLTTALPRIDNPQARWIRDSCQVHSIPMPDDSAQFVQSVTADFAVLNIPAIAAGDANAVLSGLETNSVAFTAGPPQPPAGKWVKITSTQVVNDLAKNGWLILGGLTNFEPVTNQGVVVVVVANPSAGPADQPLAYWARPSGQGQRNTSVSLLFSPAQLGNVIYYARKLGN